jgi:hypothetical protein
MILKLLKILFITIQINIPYINIFYFTFIIMELKIQKINKEQFNDYIYVFGDSHCLCFGHGDIIVNDKYNIQMLNRDSASARGLANEKSTLKYGNDILNFIYYKKGFSNKPFNSNENNNYYLFKFGQVDSQINYYYKKIIKKENIDKNIFFKEIIDDYMTFLKEFKNYNIIVCGINMPSPTNYKRYLYNCFNRINEEIINIDNDIEKITLLEMNNDTLLFNELLKIKCENNLIKYFDLTNECVIKINDKLTLNSKYVGNDHHYKGCRGIAYILSSIKNFNENNNQTIIDYINHPLYKETYYIFIKKLFTILN